MYLRTVKRKNRDGSTVASYQPADGLGLPREVAAGLGKTVGLQKHAAVQPRGIFRTFGGACADQDRDEAYMLFMF